MAELERLFGEVDHILGALRPEAPMERRTIQGRDITVFEAVLNVIQHFSHHVGQVIWIAKFHSPGAVHFVEDAKGLAHPRWRELVRPLDT